ncbi:MAG: diguanylate cyclase, partial [Acidimicrobiia bacterium]|nr:diguanylate cyclase [Acidimicrobiia bacterium]
MNPLAGAPNPPRFLPALQRAVPALIGLVVIASLGVVAMRIGRSNLHTAENDRLQVRVETVEVLSLNMTDQMDPAVSQEIVRATPFAPDGGELNEAFLQQFHNPETAATTALVSADGEPLASLPPGQGIDPEDLAGAWQVATGGTPVLSDVFAHRGVPSVATLIPVSDGPAWALVVLIQPAVDTAGQSFHEQTGSMNGESGGLMLLDRSGVAMNAWSRDRIGEEAVDPRRLADLPEGEAITWTEQRDGSEVTLIGTGLANGYSLVFEQATGLLFGDLRSAQRLQTFVLLSVVGAALSALITFQLARERSAQRAQARVHALMKNSQDLVLAAADDATLTFVSPAIEGLLGHTVESWDRRPLADLCGPDEAERIRRLLADPSTGPLLNVALLAISGESRWFDIEASDLRRHAEVRGVLLTCHEVGERKDLQDRLTRLATHDALTDLPNRALFREEMAKLETRIQRNEAVAVLCLDLDHFKAINDTL